MSPARATAPAPAPRHVLGELHEFGEFRAVRSEEPDFSETVVQRMPQPADAGKLAFTG
ncbi:MULTISPECIES: hypothetical protein [unclassified Microbacterium]|uniref:hypothetical protein n=1 Tax=unclassified Microbacterium TaxID=2609290 RepID=UPI00214C0736|nr:MULTISPECIES: hypothetical protein [unclassified Microbacterium]MCR2783313.1 hypothetical protein [Microbacterium sp. zg.B96]WIM15813.1 hypothetical protein QNO11_14980 [Microbacterium sp. zg-B96]